VRQVDFVSTDDPKQKHGYIKETPLGLVFDGLGTSVFQSLKKAYLTKPPSDAKLFSILASGWSNGPIKTVTKEI
jgi:hypothetical protein